MEFDRSERNANLLAAKPERVETSSYKGEVVPYYPAKLASNADNDLTVAVAQVREQSNLKTGLPLLTRLFTAGKLTTAAGAGLIIMIDGRQVYASNAGEARAWIDSRLQELEQKATSGGNMVTVMDVEEVFTALGEWYKKAEAANADHDKLGITEFWSHAEGKRLSEVRIPFVADTIRILKLKLGHFQGQALACSH